MAYLPPDLREEILEALCPLDGYVIERDRPDLLTSVLQAHTDTAAIDWGGSPYLFTSRLLNAIDHDAILALLAAPLVGTDVRARLDELAAQVDAAAGLLTPAAPRTPAAYQQAIVDRWSAERYQLDSRFVALTLLLDQGEAAQGLRFTNDGQQGRFQSLRTLLGAIEERAVVLLGKPGSGKTTLLRRLALEHAWEELKNPSGHFTFFVPLNAYQAENGEGPPPDPWEWLADRWAAQHSYLPSFADLFNAGRLILLLDGLNEMPHADRDDYRQRIGRWRSFWQLHHGKGNRALFSCRSLDYSAPLTSESAPVRQVRVEPLGKAAIGEFLDRYLADEAVAVRAEIEKDDDLLTLFSTPFFLRLLVDHVTVNRRMPRGAAALLTGSVRRALARECGRGGDPLLQPAAGLLTEGDLELILQPWDDDYELPDEGPLLPRLAALAWRMQDGGLARQRRLVRVRERQAREQLDHRQAREIIRAGYRLNVLDRDGRDLTFYHQLLQEYFAARLLAESPDPRRVHVPWRADEVDEPLEETLARLTVSEPLPPQTPTGWEETTRLAAALTPGPEQDAFVAALIDHNLPEAARCAAAPEVDVSPALTGRLQELLIARIGDPAADLRARIDAGLALGELGDPRFERRRGPYGDYLLPPLAPIAGGTYTIGDDDGAYDDEKPAHEVPIEPFELGVFPVTNAEYALFISAGGYEDEQWWEGAAARDWLAGGGVEAARQEERAFRQDLREMTEEQIRTVPNTTPEQLRYVFFVRNSPDDEFEAAVIRWHPGGEPKTKPQFWDDSRFSARAQPVVGVSWHEARAYCAWLSAQTGDAYMLPTEAEWEAAARGKGDRRYAYGDDFDPQRCNTFETHVRGTAPVGVFPRGGTPEGVMDLSGNVWEWTSTAYRDYEYVPDDGREDPADAAARRVLRGGSWYGYQIYARAAFRFNFRPALRYNNCGFRVVRRPPSHGR